ncbi:MAG: hypothetical protein J5793_01455 [Clostridia bacterium]|nr:hypothetical protein [Clostridia bacterium]
MTAKQRTAATVSFVGISALLAGWRTAVIIKNIEKIRENDNAYYLKDALGVKLFTAAAVIVALAAIALAVISGRKSRYVFNGDHIGSSVTSLICAFTLVAQFAVFMVMYFKGQIAPAKMEIPVYAFALVAGLVYFLRFGIKSGKQSVHNPNILALSALAPTAYCALRLLNDFVETNAAPMESSGAYHILSLSVLMLFFLTDGKSLVRNVAPARFLSLGYVSAMLLLVYSVPNLILYGIGVFNLDFSSSLIGSVTDITLAAYVFSRVASFRPEAVAPAEGTAAENAEAGEE